MREKTADRSDQKQVRCRRAVYVLLLAAAAVYVSNKGGVFSYALFYFMLFYPVASLLYLFYVRSFVRIHQEIDRREIEKYKEEPYRLIVENAGFLPVIGVRLFGERGQFREDMTGTSFSLWPGEKRHFETGITCRYAGSYDIGISDLLLNDAFDMIRIGMHIRTPLRVQVLPAFSADCEKDAGDAVQNLIRGAAVGNTVDAENVLGNDQKSYVPGDPLKWIHWKNYARSGKLFVRQPEPRPVETIAVVLLGKKIGESEEELRVRDAFIEFSISLARLFAGEHRSVQFFFYNAGVKRIPVEDDSGLGKLSFEISKEIIRRGEKEENLALIGAAETLHCPVFTVEEGICRLCPM